MLVGPFVAVSLPSFERTDWLPDSPTLPVTLATCNVTTMSKESFPATLSPGSTSEPNVTVAVPVAGLLLTAGGDPDSAVASVALRPVVSRTAETKV